MRNTRLVRFAGNPSTIGSDTEELQIGAVFGSCGLHIAVVAVGGPQVIAIAVVAVCRLNNTEVELLVVLSNADNLATCDTNRG